MVNYIRTFPKKSAAAAKPTETKPANQPADAKPADAKPADTAAEKSPN